MKKMVEFTIIGQLYSKSNSRQIVFHGKHPSVIKSAEALNYVKASTLQLKIQLGSSETIEGYIRLDIDVFYSSKKPDLDVSLLMDVMQRQIDRKTKIVLFRGVYKNDRQVAICNAKKFIDRKNPRVVVRITELTKEEIKDLNLV